MTRERERPRDAWRPRLLTIGAGAGAPWLAAAIRRPSRNDAARRTAPSRLARFLRRVTETLRHLSTDRRGAACARSTHHRRPPPPRRPAYPGTQPPPSDPPIPFVRFFPTLRRESATIRLHAGSAKMRASQVITFVNVVRIRRTFIRIVTIGGR